MILTKRMLDFLIGRSRIKEIYPMIDKIETEVNWDEDIELPFYEIDLNIYLNTNDITRVNMYQKGLDPHYLVDKYMMRELKLVGINKGEITQVYITVYNSDGKKIYGDYD
jgi:hypothetical protein